MLSVTRDMEIPHVGPLGIVNQPADYKASARRYPPSLRLATFAVLGVFVAVTVVTTAYSLGAYCLTTWGGNPFG